jgi:hypothetical protein
MRSGRWFLAAAIIGCIAATTAPATSPASATFEDKNAGIRLTYPGDWQPEKAQTALLDVAAPEADNKGYSSLSLDIPKLPWHPPGFITCGEVESGYVDDLKKNQIHDAKVDENVKITVPDSSARRVKCSGHEDGKTMIDVAVLIVHADRVYILSCDSDDAGYVAARAALDAAVASIQWVK